MGSNGTVTPLRILLVEDSQHDWLAFRRAFQRSQLPSEITRYARAEEALGLLDTHASSFDVVVIDHKLPGMSGLELCKQVLGREIPLPLVLLTGVGSEQLAVEALKAGVDDYVTKAPGQGYLDLLPVVLPDVVRRHGDRLARKRAEQALRDSEEKFRSLVITAPDAIVLTDAQGTILELNEAYAQICGCERDKILGRSFLEFVSSPESRGQAERMFQILNETGSIPAQETVVTTRTGTQVPTELTAATLKDDKGRVTNYIVIIRDITERKRTEEERKELMRMKDEFVDNVSHELRAPLFSIQGFVDLILKGKVPDPEIQREFLTRVGEQTDRLAALVDDLLDLSRLERGRLKLEREQVQMQELVQRVVRQLGNMAQDKGIALGAQVDASLPSVEADRRRVEQVLVNLVGNALKFTPSGGHVAVGATVEQDELLVYVSDTGIGIPPEAMAHLFSKFYQVDGSETRRADGTGLGLYISKLIVEAHGGRIWAESEPNRGSTFSLALPLRASGK